MMGQMGDDGSVSARFNESGREESDSFFRPALFFIRRRKMGLPATGFTEVPGNIYYNCSY